MQRHVVLLDWHFQFVCGLIQVIMALGRMWHPEHFICVHCKEMLGTQNFFERDTLPYCERDYYLLFSPRCASCNGPILDVGDRCDYSNFFFVCGDNKQHVT